MWAKARTQTTIAVSVNRNKSFFPISVTLVNRPRPRRPFRGSFTICGSQSIADIAQKVCKLPYIEWINIGGFESRGQPGVPYALGSSSGKTEGRLSRFERRPLVCRLSMRFAALRSGRLRSMRMPSWSFPSPLLGRWRPFCSNCRRPLTSHKTLPVRFRSC